MGRPRVIALAFLGALASWTILHGAGSAVAIENSRVPANAAAASGQTRPRRSKR